MKKILILSLILSTILSGCNLNNSKDITTSVTTTEPSTNTVNNSTQNYTPPTDLPDINLDNRIFTEYGFSVETSLEDVQILPTTQEINYENFASIILETMTKNFSYDENEVTTYITTPSSEYVAIRFFIPVMFMFQSNNDMNSDMTEAEQIEYLSSYINDIFDIEVQNITINNTDVIHSKIRMDIDFGDMMDELQEDTPEFIELNIFTLPHPNTELGYFDVIMETTTDENIDFIAQIENIYNSFIYDSDYSTTNEDGLKSFKSVSFSSFYNPEYFKNSLPPDHKNSMFASIESNYFELELPDKNSTLNLEINCDTYPKEYDENLIETVEINGYKFDVIKHKIAVEDGSLHDIIIAIQYHSDEFVEHCTTIKLYDTDNYSFDLEKFSSINKADLDIINSIFNTIMQNYQTDYSPQMLELLDMFARMELANLEREQKDYEEKLARSITVKTDADFSVSYDPNTAREKNNMVNGVPVDDVVKGVFVDVGVINPSINFITTNAGDILNHKSALAPTSTEYSWMSENHINRLLAYIEEMEFELTTKVLDLNGKEVTREYYNISTEVMDEYHRVFFDDEFTKMTGDSFDMVIYTYPLDGKNHIMYSTSSQGFIDYSVTSEIEFMFKNMTIN